MVFWGGGEGEEVSVGVEVCEVGLLLGEEDRSEGREGVVVFGCGVLGR